VEHDVSYRSQRDGSFTIHGGHLAVVHRWSPDELDVEVDGVSRTVRITLAGDPAGDHLHLTGAGTTTSFRVVHRFTVPGTEAPSGGLVAPMPGRVLEIRAAVGDTVTAGQTMLLLEAMKMEHHMTAPFDGTVTEVRVTVGGQVENGAVLLVIEPDEVQGEGD
jgi:propionyl-CoA carboxylase alpha chain